MKTFLAILFRCVLALGLGFTPVANAFYMAAMAAPQEAVPPCHAPAQEAQKPDGKCCGSMSQCHCAMATALPASVAVVAHVLTPADHPQTVLRLPLEQPLTPETPPPRA